MTIEQQLDLVLAAVKEVGQNFRNTESRFAALEGKLTETIKEMQKLQGALKQNSEFVNAVYQKIAKPS
jgi:uncharacterized protein YoxC